MPSTFTYNQIAGTFLGGGWGGRNFFFPEMTLFIAVSGNTTTNNVVYFD